MQMGQTKENIQVDRADWAYWMAKRVKYVKWTMWIDQVDQIRQTWSEKPSESRVGWPTWANCLGESMNRSREMGWLDQVILQMNWTERNGTKNIDIYFATSLIVLTDFCILICKFCWNLYQPVSTLRICDGHTTQIRASGLCHRKGTFRYMFIAASNSLTTSRCSPLAAWCR